MRKILSGFCLMSFLLFGITGVSQADLTKIGVVEYDNGPYYAMIYDDDIDLVWLDYSNPGANWDSQREWATSLNTNGVMTYYWFPGYEDFITWTGDWRLPDAHNQDGTGPDFGYNITGSEMGHLFYEELGLSGDSVTNAQLNASEFNNLRSTMYWSGTEYADVTGNAWFFKMNDGFQHYYKSNYVYGLAVRSGQVSAVPVPGAIWLLGSGLLATVGIRRKGHH